MILWPEQKLLHWLTREYFTGEGAIGDLGCFIGSSTMSLASGLDARMTKNPVLTEKCIHSYDLFIAPDDPYTLERLPEGHGPGSRFRAVFDAQTKRLANWIQVHDGDLRKDPWEAGPIEILFIDICKCWSTNQSVLQTFFPHLIAGHSIVVHQDYVRVWNPWIPVSMAALGEYFEVLTEVESSRVYRCVKEIPNELLAVDYRLDLDLTQKRDLLKESISKSPPHTAAIHTGALAMLVFMEGDSSDARGILLEAMNEHATDAEAMAVFKTLEETMDYWKSGAAYESEMEDKF